MEIAGPSPLTPAALLKIGDFKTGDVANFDRVHEGLERIRLAVRREGYLKAKVTSERNINDEKKTVAIAVRIDPGPQYMMGQLTLVGLDLEGEAEMRRVWTMKEGKVFNPEYPDHFLTRIKEEGVFEDWVRPKRIQRSTKHPRSGRHPHVRAVKIPRSRPGGAAGEASRALGSPSFHKIWRSMPSSTAHPCRGYPDGAPAGGPSLPWRRR